MSFKLAALLATIAVIGHAIGLETADSDGDVTLITSVCVFLVLPIFTLGWATRRLFRGAGRSLGYSFWRLGLCICIGLLAGVVGWWRVHPSSIRFRFRDGTGASGTWREVQFEHYESGRWIVGPWVGAWPMSVRFPDIDGDGYRDIEVTGHGRVVLQYLPKNDGRRFWRLVERTGAYEVNYPPDNVTSP